MSPVLIRLWTDQYWLDVVPSAESDSMLIRSSPRREKNRLSM